MRVHVKFIISISNCYYASYSAAAKPPRYTPYPLLPPSLCYAHPRTRLIIIDSCCCCCCLSEIPVVVSALVVVALAVVVAACYGSHFSLINMQINHLRKFAYLISCFN